MGQPVATPRVPDGYRDRLLALADRVARVRADIDEARRDRRDPHVAMLHASIDASDELANIDDAIRRLRR